MDGQRPIKWAQCNFNEEEWEFVQQTWQRLVDEEKIVFGHKPPVRANMDRLLEELKKTDVEFKRKYRTGFPAGSKKYRRIYTFVERQGKNKRLSGQASQSSAQSARSVLNMPDDDSVSMYFGDAPPVTHSQIVNSSAI